MACSGQYDSPPTMVEACSDYCLPIPPSHVTATVSHRGYSREENKEIDREIALLPSHCLHTACSRLTVLPSSNVI